MYNATACYSTSPPSGTPCRLDSEWNISYLVLSFCISCFGAQTSLEVIQNRTGFSGLANWLWLIAAALGIGGVGIFSMHFIGMIALSLHFQGTLVPFAFEPLLTLLSLLAGAAGAIAGLAISGDPNKPGLIRLVGGGIVAGAGVGVMHYTGMAAMSGEMVVVWDHGIVALSLVIGIVAASAAFFIYFHLRSLWSAQLWKRCACSAIMGCAVCGMHYTGMQAATFHYRPSAQPVDYSHMLQPGDMVVAVTVLAVGMSLLLLALSLRAARARTKRRRQQQHITLAAFYVDDAGRVLLSPDGALPTVEVVPAWQGRGTFDTANTLFPLLLRCSRHWRQASAIVPAALSTEQQEQLETRQYSKYFQWRFISAARALAEQLGVPLPQLGALCDQLRQLGSSGGSGGDGIMAGDGTMLVVVRAVRSHSGWVDGGLESKEGDTPPGTARSGRGGGGGGTSSPRFPGLVWTDSAVAAKPLSAHLHMTEGECSAWVQQTVAHARCYGSSSSRQQQPEAGSYVGVLLAHSTPSGLRIAVPAGRRFSLPMRRLSEHAEDAEGVHSSAGKWEEAQRHLQALQAELSLLPECQCTPLQLHTLTPRVVSLTADGQAAMLVVTHVLHLVPTRKRASTRTGGGAAAEEAAEEEEGGNAADRVQAMAQYSMQPLPVLESGLYSLSHPAWSASALTADLTKLWAEKGELHPVSSPISAPPPVVAGSKKRLSSVTPVDVEVGVGGLAALPNLEQCAAEACESLLTAELQPPTWLRDLCAGGGQVVAPRSSNASSRNSTPSTRRGRFMAALRSFSPSPYLLSASPSTAKRRFFTLGDHDGGCGESKMPPGVIEEHDGGNDDDGIA